MSLGRLLTAGRSLIGLQDPTTSYRMRSRYLLPKFGSGRNPFTTSTKAEVVAAMPETAAPEQPVRKKAGSYRLSPTELAAASLKETRRLPEPEPATATAPAVAPAPALAVAPAAVSASRPSPGSALRHRLGAWVRRWNPLTWRRRGSVSRPAAVRSHLRTPVQGELSLDNVRVVRNDLSDADVEIVAAKRAAKGKAPSEAPDAPAEFVETRST